MNTPRDNERRGPVRKAMRFALFRDSWISTRELVPNFFTLLSICCALLAIRWAVEREFSWSAGAILVSAILDGIDGRAARMLHAQSKFGEEFDSLADFVSFGVAPAILIFNWGLSSLEGVGWVAVTALAIACGVRLARFNAAIGRERDAWEQDYLTGVPAPAGAIISLLPLYLDGLLSTGDPLLPGFPNIWWAPWAIVIYTLTVAFLMVSTIPTFAGKMTGDRLMRQYPLLLLLMAAGALWLLRAYPYATLAAGTLIYLLLMPLGVRRYIQLDRLEGDDDDIDAGLTQKPGE